MSDLTIGLLSIPALLIVLALRVPIALALGGVSLVGLFLVRGPGPTLAMFSSMPLDFAASWTLSAVPMFVLMGALAYHTGLTEGLFRAGRIFLSRLPGGLAVATNIAAAGFAAASGSSLASCAAMGRIAIPEMLKAGYDKAMASATVAASGTLGALIPPSLLFVLYGWFTETSIAALLIAGILPGLLTAFIYSVMIMIRVKLKPSLAPRTDEVYTRQEKVESLIQIWPIPLLVLGVVGAMYSGLATATEAAAIGAFLAILIALGRRTMSRYAMKTSIVETLQSCATIFFVAIGAMLLTRFFAFAGVPDFLSDQIAHFGLSQIWLVLGVCVLYLILGAFLEPMGIMLLTLPVIIPVLDRAGADPIWIGVIIVKLLEIGMLTPPVGMNVYVVKGVVGDAIPLGTIFRGVTWFLVAEIFIMALIIGFPSISTFLPNQLLSR